MSSWREERPLKGAKGLPCGMASSQDNRLLARSAEKDRFIHLWSVNDHAQIAVLYGAGSDVETFGPVFSPDGSMLAVTSGAQGQVYLWRTR